MMSIKKNVMFEYYYGSPVIINQISDHQDLNNKNIYFEKTSFLARKTTKMFFLPNVALKDPCLIFLGAKISNLYNVEQV